MLGQTGTSGKWAVDPTTRTLHVLHSTAPTEVFVPIQDTLVLLEGRANVVLSGMTFVDQGFSATGVQVRGACWCWC